MEDVVDAEVGKDEKKKRVLNGKDVYMNIC